MFSYLAGMYMAAKTHLTQAKINAAKRSDNQVSEIIYKNKTDKNDRKEQFRKSRMPESGYMTLEEYESKSRALTRKEINEKVLDKPDMPKDKNYVYVPQHKFKLVKYNDPVGSPELTLPRKLQFDRQINAQGIVSGDYKMLVYPSVYYYAEADCVSCDLFRINLDSTLSNVEKVRRANVVNRDSEPLLSTSKDIDRKSIFRTLTPIDFSSDNKKLLIKEKVGHRHDGIWKTDIWIYDFDKKEAKCLSALREAIIHYWKQNKDINLTENRWDIYPMGFDANNENRVVVCAYAYTGSTPEFLGTWSIDVDNKISKIESLTGSYIPISIVGYKLSEEFDTIPMSELKFEAKQAKKEVNAQKKEDKKNKRIEDAANKFEYKKEMRQMDAETLIKIKERQKYLKSTKKKPVDGITNNTGENYVQQDSDENIQNNETSIKGEIIDQNSNTEESDEIIEDLDEI